MPELDTIRGIAVLLVLFFHGFGFRYGLVGLAGIPKLFVAATLPGWVGVNLFFVLSGFLITGILLDTKNRADYYRRFYLRRALRILPVYYAVLFLLAVATRVHLVERPISWQFLGLSCVYLANVTDLLGVPMQFGVLWSLAVEEHFYLLWPSAVHSLSRRALALVATLICVLCLLLRILYCIRGYSAGAGYTWLVADGLAMGALLALSARGSWGTRVCMARVAMIAIAASLALFGVGAHFGIFQASHFLGQTLRQTGLNLFCGGLIASTLIVGTSSWKRIVNRPLLQFLGEISYGIYLFHMLIFEVVDHELGRFFPGFPQDAGHFGAMVLRFCSAAGLSIGVAYLSRWYFEEPFLKFKERIEKKNAMSHARLALSLREMASDEDLQPA